MIGAGASDTKFWPLPRAPQGTMVLVGDVWWFGEEIVGNGRSTLPHVTKESQTAGSKVDRGMTQYLGLRSTGVGLVRRYRIILG